MEFLSPGLLVYDRLYSPTVFCCQGGATDSVEPTREYLNARFAIIVQATSSFHCAYGAARKTGPLRSASRQLKPCFRSPIPTIQSRSRCPNFSQTLRSESTQTLETPKTPLTRPPDNAA